MNTDNSDRPPTMTDRAALDAIAARMDGREWTTFELDYIADTVRQTGRQVRDPQDAASECALCGEATAEGDIAEMYDPDRRDVPAVVCHPDCGRARGLKVA